MYICMYLFYSRNKGMVIFSKLCWHNCSFDVIQKISLKNFRIKRIWKQLNNLSRKREVTLKGEKRQIVGPTLSNAITTSNNLVNELES